MAGVTFSLQGKQGCDGGSYDEKSSFLCPSICTQRCQHANKIQRGSEETPDLVLSEEGEVSLAEVCAGLVVVDAAKENQV